MWFQQRLLSCIVFLLVFEYLYLFVGVSRSENLMCVLYVKVFLKSFYKINNNTSFKLAWNDSFIEIWKVLQFETGLYYILYLNTDIQTKNMSCQDFVKCMKKKSSDNSDRMNQNISIL